MSSLEDVVARYATSAAGVALLVAAFAARAVSADVAYRRELRGAQGYLALFLAASALREVAPARWHRLDKSLFVAGLVLFAFGAIRGVAATVSQLHRRRTGVETPRILRDLVDGVLFVLALLIILQATLSVNLSAVLASSAVISLVLGLALQETLGNLFAGLSLQAERPLAEGDWVRIGAHQGKVAEIGWRATRLVTGSGESLTIPNNAVAKEAVYNLTRRGASLRKVTLTVGYDVPPNALKEEALALVRAHPQVAVDPAPVVRTADLGATGIAYEVIFWVERWEVGGAAEDEIRSQLWYRLHRAGIALSALGSEVRLARTGRPAEGIAEVDVPALLARVDFLSTLDPASRQLLAQRARVVRYGRGEIVARQGDALATCFVVAEGELSARVRSADGREREVARLGPGACFGELSALAGELGAATSVAVRDCALVEIDRAAFDELLSRAPEEARALTAALAARGEATVHEAEAAAPGPRRPPEASHHLLAQMRGIFKHLR